MIGHHSSLSSCLMLGLMLFLIAGCSGPQSTTQSDNARDDSERISGGIAAVAGEAAGKEDTVTRKDVESRPGAFAEELLQGRVPGVEVIERPGGGFSIRIRGNSSIMGSNEPLYVVDGMQVMDDTRGGLSWLNIHDIEKIEVLKNASDTAIYGTRGGMESS